MMAYCPECGSEVAPTNTFCAYCGIALQPALPVENEPSQTDFSVSGEADSHISPDKIHIEENSQISGPEDNSQSSAGDSAPPTPFILEQKTPVAEIQSQRSSESNFEPGLSKDTAESWSVKTDSIQLDTVSKEPLIDDNEVESETPTHSPENLSGENAGNNQDVTTNETPQIENPEKVNEDAEQINPNLPESEEKPFSLMPIDIPLSNENAVISENTPPENILPIARPQIDFEYADIQNDPEYGDTIPYTPTDYAAHSLKMESSKVETGGEKVSEDDENKSTEIFSSEEFIKSLGSESNQEVVDHNLNSDNFLADLSETGSAATNLSVSGDTKQKQSDSDNLLNLEGHKSIEIPDTPIPEPPAVTPVFISLLPKEEASTETRTDPVVAENIPPVAEIKSASKENRTFTNPIVVTGDTDGNKAAKLKPLEEGVILNGRYEVVRKIGGGGMGAVYLASDRNLGGVLRAVKEMVQSSIEDEQQEKAILDFKRESTILSGLEHPAIPTIFDYFFDDHEGRFYLVMRYISGGDLAARLRSAPEGKIDESTVTDWGIQLADVLNYLHKQEPPIVYRDLKPSNIMIDGNTGRIMLIDFGIARLINADQTDVTAVGTMGYAPPELYRKNVEPRSDIFSLGSTMFHLLTGADPQSNPLLIFDFNKNPRPRQINSQLSDQIEQILMRAVELDSANRFDTAAEMRDTLKTHLDNLLKGAVTYGVVTASSKVSSASNLPVFCGFCGQKIVATDQFCPFCGSLQPTAGQSSKLQAPPVYAAPKMTARVMVIGTSDLNMPEFSLDKETNLVGRRDPMSNIFPEVDLSKFDPQTKISRKHARIWRESDVYMLEDLGSSNGTVLISSVSDSVRLLPRQPHVLTNGDKIKVGDTTLHFFIG